MTRYPRFFLMSFLTAFFSLLEGKAWNLLPKEGQSVIAEAIEAASPGDTIRLLSGVFRESVVINKPLKLVGSEGAILDPSQEIPGSWEPATEIGERVWKLKAPRKPEALFFNGRTVAEVVKKRSMDQGSWNWKTLLSEGLPQSGFSLIKGLFVYDPESSYVYAKIESPDHTRGRWRWLDQENAALTFSRVDGASVQGLQIAGSVVAVKFGKGAANCTVRDCTISGYESTGILITDNADSCLVLSNNITRGSLESYASSYSGIDVNQKPDYEIWKLHKERGNYDSVGVNLHRSGINNRVISNQLLLNFDGIDIGDYAVQFTLKDPLLYPNQCRGTEVAWNKIEHTKDSGMELGAGAIDVRIHHNLILRSHGGLRLKIPRIGPVYIYQNRFEECRRMNFWFSMDSSPAKGYFYHNTVVGYNTATAYWGFGKDDPAGPMAPNWYLINNLFITTNGLFSSMSKNNPVPDFKFWNNLVVGPSAKWEGNPENEKGSKFLGQISQGKSGQPDAADPLLFFGMNLTLFLEGAPLPGCEPGSYSGKNPPVGAFDLGGFGKK